MRVQILKHSIYVCMSSIKTWNIPCLLRAGCWVGLFNERQGRQDYLLGEDSK